MMGRITAMLSLTVALLVLSTGAEAGSAEFCNGFKAGYETGYISGRSGS